MRLTRRQMLDEMGLSPQWVLRARAESAGIPAHAGAAMDEAQDALDEARNESDAAFALPESAPAAAPGGALPDNGGAIAGMDWPQLRRAIAACRLCSLCAKRKQAVPGVGDEHADWLFIGEGPGAEEDARGEPFVGQAGRLLDAMLAAIDLKRGENVYIANAVKCRPPGNRTPAVEEMAACWPYLQRQIELLRPKLIVLLGKAAVVAVLGEARSLASMRGHVLNYRQDDLEIPVIVTYHPAYLLRNLPDKAKAWEDLCRARTLMRSLMDMS